MAWYDTLMLLGVLGSAVGVMGVVLTLVRALPWGRDWHAGGYR